MKKAPEVKAYVMDSSAALAILLNEKGTDIALGFAPDGAMQFRQCGRNHSEADRQGTLHGRGSGRTSPASACRSALSTKLMGIAAGQLRELTRHRGLSLGDRACLALAIRENAIAVTADRAWGDLDIGCKIELIR